MEEPAEDFSYPEDSPELPELPDPTNTEELTSLTTPRVALVNFSNISEQVQRSSTAMLVSLNPALKEPPQGITGYWASTFIQSLDSPLRVPKVFVLEVV
ncbi:hypothetical protein UY3_10282 [Chelonia mydas]|uniref:Uncharacterized protein n=1 Tax=Chelonia mydas TaxID=8469 RepID=M7BKM5_CHEMY|nr:hypothetical protein UY3_10282 [Chelonia mydas]